jgi:aspartyl protease family protein
MGALFTVLLLTTAVGLAAMLTDSLPLGLTTPDALYVMAGLLIAGLTFATLLQGRSFGFFKALRDLTAWAAIMLAMVAGYSFRDDLVALGTRVVAEISPPGSVLRADTQTDGEKAVKIRRRPDGHFIARTDLNGFSMTMLVDTGASTVVLRPADAQKIGIDVDRLKFSVPVQTANGTTYAAPIKLKRVAVGSIEFTEVDALVAKPGALRDSLLGMSFLNRLRSYEFSGDFLTLRI